MVLTVIKTNVSENFLTMLTMKKNNKIIEIGLENIMDLCDKTTSGNISHNIPTIKFIAESLLKVWHNEI